MEINNILQQLRQQRSQIDQAISALGRIGGTAAGRGRPPKSAQPQATGKRRRMSAAARAKIAAAQRARWAKQKGQPTKSTTAAKKSARRGGISAAARKRLSDLMKARWAARKKR